jgi:hypothetical protein
VGNKERGFRLEKIYIVEYTARNPERVIASSDVNLTSISFEEELTVNVVVDNPDFSRSSREFTVGPS